MERSHIITLEDDVVTHRLPDGVVETLPLKELAAVIIETNDLGPFATDCFWILIGQEHNGSRQGCRIPQGATGDAALLERLQALPGFDNAAFINAMTVTHCQTILVWESGEVDEANA